MRENERYYQVVFIWLKDPQKFGRYVELLRPIVGRYGGALERMLAPDAVHAEGMQKPDVINVVYYDDKAAFMAFHADAEFQRIVRLRTESIEMMSVQGPPTAGSPTSTALEKRQYVLELARYDAHGAEGYKRYETEAEALMGRHGYHVERVFAPDSATDFPFTPDLVKVAYFDDAAGMTNVHADPAHHRVETTLYAQAVQQSVWVVGRVHPASLANAGPQ
jgi:uncharacterized protein (DUF1330 family)